MDDPCPVVLCGNCGKQGSQIEMESSPEFEPDDTPSLFQRFTRRVKNLFAR